MGSFKRLLSCEHDIDTLVMINHHIQAEIAQHCANVDETIIITIMKIMI